MARGITQFTCHPHTNHTRLYSASTRHHHGLYYITLYCNRKIIVCGLPDADRQRYSDKFKSLIIDKCPNQSPRTNWTDDLAVPENGINNITIENH